MSDLNSLINSLPVDRLAQQFGVSGDDIRKAVQNIAPALVGGMQANARDPKGAESLQTALSDHANNSQHLLNNPNLEDIDTNDGQAIAHHIFGQNEGAVVDKVSANSAVDKGLIEKLLPIVAPLVMAWLASRFLSNRGPNQTEQAEFDRSAEAPTVPGETGVDRANTPASSKDLEDMLGGVLGGNNSASAQAGQQAGAQQGGLGGGLGDLLGSLGGLLGGGRR